MRNIVILMFLTVFQVFASDTYSQSTVLSLNMDQVTVKNVLREIEDISEFYFLYNSKLVDDLRIIDAHFERQKIDEILAHVFDDTNVEYVVIDRQIVLSPAKYLSNVKFKLDPLTITGKVTDTNNEPLAGVTVFVKGTTQGTITDVNGNYLLTNIPEDATLVFSYVGMITQEVIVGSQTIINVTLEEAIVGIEEVVAIGYGTMRKSDITGAVGRMDKEEISVRPNISLIQSLQGALPGLNIGQVNEAGEEPSLSIRGITSLAGEQAPLIVLDGNIYRGNLIDINPDDVESIDILKDASSAAIYGSQATNGVIIITTQKGEVGKKPMINYSASYSFQESANELIMESPEEQLQRLEAGYWKISRTEESGYIERNPTWDLGSAFRTSEQLHAYENNILTDWHPILTNDVMYTQNHNLSLSGRTNNHGYFTSIGYTDQRGYMVNEDYSRWNARINLDNSITGWLKIGIQSFLTLSDYSGLNLNPNTRFQNHWYAPAYNEDGSLVLSPYGVGSAINPLYIIDTDNIDKRLNLYGNIYAEIDIPFIKGLSFKTNYYNDYTRHSYYLFEPWGNNFTGIGSKSDDTRRDWSNDNILTYNNTFNDIHKVIVTLVYGAEKREYSWTQASATNFVSMELGYNSLQAGDSEKQSASSNAWTESSLYEMGRLFYSYRNKYLLTGTIRRDGFSGFSEKNKIGVFPSVAIAWVASNENLLKELLKIFDQLKIRASYGSNGNRTINRYQTLAKVGGGYNYVTGDKKPIYTQEIITLASPNLKWESTIGLNVGIDYSLFKFRVIGSIDYYTTDTKNLLYNVDIPGISRFETFPDNLGRLHNNGLELSISSVNIRNNNFSWTSKFVFSRNRNELKELLGYDNDGDGKEDDLVSEGLFIGEPLSAIYTYYTDGELWRIGDDIPATADIGSYKIKDINGDGEITPDDRKIIGYSDPSFRFSIDNIFSYKNWMLSVFINSVQGSDRYYLGSDNINTFYSQWDTKAFPKDLDFWRPENPDARYEQLDVQRPIEANIYIPRSFVRLQDVNLSYNFRKEFLNKIKIQNLRLFFNGKNLLTWTKWPGWDPETGQTISIDGTPVMRNYTFGIEVEF